ncbi:uncharacterized mitochondrial protein-like protein [Tanacetum coccineum]
MVLSSCEVEFMGATTAGCQTIWLKELLVEVAGLERQKVIIRVDNKSTISLSMNSVFHSRSKHIHTRYHFIRERVENEQGFLDSGGRNNNHRKKTYTDACTGSFTESDGTLNDVDPLKEVVSLSVIDELMAMEVQSPLVA